MKIRWSSLALAELDAMSELAAKNPAAAKRFEFRVRQIVQRIERFPAAFQALIAMASGACHYSAIRILSSIQLGQPGSSSFAFSMARAKSLGRLYD